MWRVRRRLVVLFRRRRFSAGAWIGVLALVSVGAWLWVLTMPPAPVVAGTGAAAGHSRRATSAPTSHEATSHQVTDVPIGLYTGPGGRASALVVDRQLDGHVEYALDFLDETSWATITQPAWVATVWRSAPFRMILGVPMMPRTGATLAEGAQGLFDGQYRLLAARLVADGLGTAVLMIGWQPDDQGQPWYVGSEAAARDYVRYWDRIRATMASVPGAHFLYEWDAGDSGSSPLSPAAMYPGNGAVDVVATDAFDRLAEAKPGATRWRSLLEERYGPAWMASFAAAHHKPMAIAMSGVVPLSAQGGGDDPGFVRGLVSWASSARVEMCVLWDYGSWALTGGGYPAAGAALIGVVNRPSGAGAAGSGVGVRARRAGS